MTPPDMPCHEIVEVITEYLEGTLPDPDRTRFEAHLAVCQPCVRYLEEMRQTVIALRGLHDQQIPDGQREKLLSLFRDWRAASD